MLSWTDVDPNTARAEQVVQTSRMNTNASDQLNMSIDHGDLLLPARSVLITRPVPARTGISRVIRERYGGGAAPVANATAACATFRLIRRPVRVGFTDPTATNRDWSAQKALLTLWKRPLVSVTELCGFEPIHRVPAS